MEGETSRIRSTRSKFVEIFQRDEVASLIMEKIPVETTANLPVVCWSMKRNLTIQSHLKAIYRNRQLLREAEAYRKVLSFSDIFKEHSSGYILKNLSTKSAASLIYSYPHLLQNPYVLTTLLDSVLEPQLSSPSSSSSTTHPHNSLFTMSHLFDDKVMHRILCCMSIKDLRRITRGSNNLKRLLSNPSFIKSHLERSKTRPKLLIVTLSEDSIIISTPKNGIEGGQAILKKSIPWATQCAILGPLHGIFCFVDHEDYLCRVLNPGTGQITPWVPTCIRLQQQYANLNPIYGFGFDPSTGNHKVMCTWEISRNKPGYGTMIGKVDYICEVWTVGDKEFRRIDQVPPVLLVHEAAFYANGSIYRRNRDLNSFKAPEKEFLVAFDLATEKFRLVEIPYYIVNSSSRGGSVTCWNVDLLQVDGCIGLMDRVHERCIKLWISDDSYLKEGATTQWTEEVINFDDFSWKKGERLDVCEIEGTKTLIFKPPISSDEIGPIGSVDLALYDRIGKKFEIIKISGISPLLKSPFLYGLYSFYESLVPIIAETELDQSTPTSSRMGGRIG